jgi:glycopeptide antibiotics resistance protein
MNNRRIHYLVLCCVVMLAVTMMPNAAVVDNKTGKVNLRPFYYLQEILLAIINLSDRSPVGILGSLVHFLGNVVLFVPFGALVCSLAASGKHPIGRSVVLACVLGSTLSTFIEIAQYWHPTRTTSVGDILLNSSGALLGAILGIRETNDVQGT